MRLPIRRLRRPRALDADTAYARWAPYYPARAHNRLMAIEEEAVVSLLPPLAGRTVLDAACGTGRYLDIVSRAGAAAAIGIDRSAGMLACVHPRRASLVRGDLRRLPFAGAFADVVVCGLALMDVPELGPPLQELARVLVPGGVLVYSTVHPSGGPMGWSRTFDTPDGRFTVEAWWHSVAQHLEACAAAGLAVTGRREPVLTGRSPVGDVPAVLVIRADKVA